MTSEDAPRPTGTEPGTDDTGLSSADAVRKDRTYGPASDTETAQKQDETLSDNVDPDIDADQVQVAPGTGGPDDIGEVEVDPADLNLPWRD
ncbi:hypothetical protein ACFXP7_08645 [Microbacterium sp. P06]|uniref:hypothetical protein n=1 Tax=Microbacterium sp. P06 TaxID=3366949 RepID=UPI0037460900